MGDTPNLREAVKQARALGAEVSWVRRTGEIRFAHPQLPQRVRMNSRRKDASAHLRLFLRKLRALKEKQHGDR